jgi:FKBP-type peptidyl-prolyl cis-trans isomerase
MKRYVGIAKQNNMHYGTMWLESLYRSYDDLLNRTTPEKLSGIMPLQTPIRVNITINNSAELERAYGMLGALTHTPDQFEFIFDLTTRESYEWAAAEQAKRERQQETDKKEAEEKKQAALQDGINFLMLNKIKPGVKVREDGLQYKVLKLGQGLKPALLDSVKMEVTYSTIMGEVLYKQTPTVRVSDIFPQGLKEGVTLMPQGSKYMFYIPYDLANNWGMAGLPSTSTLVIETTLLSVKKSK